MAKPYGDDLRRKFLLAYDRGEETLEELSLAPPADPSLSHPTIETTRDLFVASVQLASQRWSIRQDSRIWSQDDRR